jgi:hypothetical protein
LAVEITSIITCWDTAYLARHMRQADIDEAIAFSGEPPHQAIVSSLELASHSWMALRDGRPAAVFGCTPVADGVGMPWFLGTDAASGDPASMTRFGRAVIADMLKTYRHLINFVDARNVKAVRWLRFMGFTIGDPEPQGVLGLPFHRFEMSS